MLRSLPAELALMVLHSTAETFTTSHRRTVVSLAQTAHFVYAAVRPILYRRLVVTRGNKRTIKDFLANKTLAVFVRELLIQQFDWSPHADILANFCNLNSLSGNPSRVQYVLDRLPLEARSSLRTVHVWNTTLLANIPPSVSHVCLYLQHFDDRPPLRPLLDWLATAPSITHLGLEVVSHSEHPLVVTDADREPDGPRTTFARNLARELSMLLESSSLHLRQLSVRMAGWMARDLAWTAAIQVLRQEAASNASIGQRLYLWRDCRHIDSLHQDADASISDAFAGVTVWDQGRPVLEC